MDKKTILQITILQTKMTMKRDIEEGTNRRRKGIGIYPSGSKSTQVCSIRTLLASSDASPANISTARELTTRCSRSVGVAKLSSTSRSTAMARSQRLQATTLRATIAVANAHATAAQPAAAATRSHPAPPIRPHAALNHASLTDQSRPLRHAPTSQRAH